MPPRTLPCTLVLFCCLPALSAVPPEEGFRPLLNGRDLDGWVLVNTPPATWSVQDGLLICSGKPIGEIRTERMYQNFILELEWRHMVPKGNAGVFVWADDITARGVPFHRGIEVQVLENAYGNSRSHTTHGDIFPIHGARMTPWNGRGGSRAFPTEELSRPSPEWNHYRIECRDGRISLAVNGKLVTQGADCSPRKGYICLESEGGVVHYRDVYIKELPESPVDPQDVAVANRGYRSLYTGLDLSGWTGERKSLASWRVRDWVLAYEGQAGDEETALSTTEAFGDFGFVVDFRRQENSGPLTIKLRGSDRGAVALDEADAAIAEHLVAAGGWNRVEGLLRGDRLWLSLNGEQIRENARLAELPDRGPLTLAPKGPVDFANIFVRQLTAAQVD